MKSLPSAVIPEVYAVNSKNPWLHFLDITLNTTPTPTLLYFVRNTEDVTYGGQLYTGFPFDPDVHKEISKGEIPTRTIKVSNTLRYLESYLESLGGAVASAVTWTIVNYAHLTPASDYADLAVTYEIIATSCDEQWVYFTLGAPYITSQRFPLHVYAASYCAWLPWYAVANMECNYSGALATCKGTLEDCRAHGNSVNFGGQVGMLNPNFRLV
jgi:phage-related protein